MILSKAKAIGAMVGFTALLSAVWYVDHLRSENEILTLNNIAHEQAIEEIQKYADEQVADAAVKQAQSMKRQKQLVDLTRLNEKLNDELSKESAEVVDCLATVPSDDFINKLREHTAGEVHPQD